MKNTAAPAPGRYRIEVEDTDIEAGVRDQADQCPVALAGCRALGVEEGVCVDGGVLEYWPRSGPGLVGTLPQEAGDFIHLFDNGLKVGPVAFEVTVFATPTTERVGQ